VLDTQGTGVQGIVAISRVVAPWSLASVAFAMIAFAFNANEPSVAPSSDRPLAGDAAVAPAALEQHTETSAASAVFDRRAHVAVAPAPLGAGGATELQRALSSRGEPGLNSMPVAPASAAQQPVTPVALRPPSQPGLSAARPAGRP
jgi:hypothetical protein